MVEEEVEFEGNWEDLFNFLPSLDRDAGEFTVRDVMTKFGVSYNRAVIYCRNLLAAGQLRSGKRYDPQTGKNVTAYWKVE